MPKVIHSEIREVVLKVKEYFSKEKEARAPIIPFKNVNERVAAATGISVRSVSRIINEARLAEALGTKHLPKPNRKTRKDKISLDNLDVEVLQQKISDYIELHHEIPSIKNLHIMLRDEDGFKGSAEILRQHMKNIGFRFYNTKNNKKIWIEINA